MRTEEATCQSVRQLKILITRLEKTPNILTTVPVTFCFQPSFDETIFSVNQSFKGVKINFLLLILFSTSFSALV
mgnify:CR=1 FL=1